MKSGTSKTSKMRSYKINVLDIYDYLDDPLQPENEIIYEQEDLSPHWHTNSNIFQDCPSPYIFTIGNAGDFIHRILAEDVDDYPGERHFTDDSFAGITHEIFFGALSTLARKRFELEGCYVDDCEISRCRYFVVVTLKNMTFHVEWTLAEEGYAEILCKISIPTEDNANKDTLDIIPIAYYFVELVSTAFRLNGVESDIYLLVGTATLHKLVWSFGHYVTRATRIFQATGLAIPDNSGKVITTGHESLGVDVEDVVGIRATNVRHYLVSRVGNVYIIRGHLG